MGGNTGMHYIHARLALLPAGWANDVRIAIESGRIAAVTEEIPSETDDALADVLIPGMPNLHSHAFQRAMAGLTEVRGPSEDSFWTWREIMYRFAQEMTPEQVESVASLAYMEMLEGGFTRVGEFHYLHHDRDGQPYADVAEMAARIASAAARAGIGLTLLPVYYAHAGFGRTPPTHQQRRFISDLDRYSELLERSQDVIRELDGAVVGVAPHSLRAASLEEVEAIATMLPDAPLHIHIAEQHREVEECVRWSGKRPVEVVLDAVDVNERWCLIHATHLTASEVEQLAATGAVAGLCPVTEANLGDGIFPGANYIGHGGRYGVGTDSNIAIGAAGELRQLEYSQRLQHFVRNVMASKGSTGRSLLDAARRGGSTALGAPSAGIATGAPADLVSLSSDRLDTHDGDVVLNGWIFTEQVSVSDVWVAGNHVVHQGRHLKYETITSEFRTVMRQLLDVIGR